MLSVRLLNLLLLLLLLILRLLLLLLLSDELGFLLLLLIPFLLILLLLILLLHLLLLVLSFVLPARQPVELPHRVALPQIHLPQLRQQSAAPDWIVARERILLLVIRDRVDLVGVPVPGRGERLLRFLRLPSRPGLPRRSCRHTIAEGRAEVESRR